MRWLITGATGFKGAWLGAYLKAKGETVVGLCGGVRKRNAFLFDSIHKEIDAPLFQFDICNSTQLKEAINTLKPDCIIHLAGQALVSESLTAPEETFRTNVVGTVSLLSALKEYTDRLAVVCITSDKCYENKEWPWPYRESDTLGGKDNYSASKACAELAVRSMIQSYKVFGSNIKVGTARAGNVIGGGDFSVNRLIPDFVRHLDRREVLTIRRPNATRPWQHVLDPISGYVRFAEALFTDEIDSGQSLNFGPSIGIQDYSVRNVLDLLMPYFDEVNVRYESSDLGNIESGLLALSPEKAKDRLGWVAKISFEQAVDYTARFYYGMKTGENSFKMMSEQINQFLSQYDTANH